MRESICVRMTSLDRRSVWLPACCLAVLVVLSAMQSTTAMCNDPCQMVLTETIPENLTFTEGEIHASHFDSWQNLLNIAEKSIDIGSFYWTLRGNDTGKVFPSSWKGQAIYDGFLEAGTKRGIDIRIVVSKPNGKTQDDTAALAAAGAAMVRQLDMEKLIGNGILHTKMWIVDDKHIYVGSANFDWRSLSEVKETGAVIYNCSCMATDLQKIFDVYWLMSAPDAKVPSSWPSSLATKYNIETPMEVYYNKTYARSYLSSAPPEFCPTGRSNDIDAILDVMDKAQKFIYIEVMEYLPTTFYGKLQKEYWAYIDDKMRSMSFNRKVKVRFMLGYWEHTPKQMLGYLRSLQALNSTGVNPFEVKLFKVPSSKEQAEIPFARVNHDKFMVTDNAAYIGTSNWIADYFIWTGGVGLVVNQTTDASSGTHKSTSGVTLQQQMLKMFERDWNSKYAEYVY